MPIAEYEILIKTFGRTAAERDFDDLFKKRETRENETRRPQQNVFVCVVYSMFIADSRGLQGGSK